MKYFLIEIAEGDSKIAGYAVYKYETRNEAIAAFHQKMASAMKSELFTKEQLLVIDDGNSVIKSEIFIRYIEKDVVENPTEE